MSNIGFVIDSLNGGGAERVVLNLTKKIVELGHVVHIFILKDEVDYKIDRNIFKLHVISDTGKVHPIRFFNKRKLAMLLRKKIDKQNITFDLFVSHLEASDEVTKIAKLPNLYHCIHGVISKFIESKYKNTKGFKKFRRKYKYFFKMKSQYDSTKLITVSQGVADDLTKFGIKPHGCTTIYNPFDFDAIRKSANEKVVDEDNYIICVARFAKDKRHDLLIKAYAASNIEQKLLLLGTTDKPSDDEQLANLKNLIRELHIEDKVIFKGFIANPYPWIKKAKALVLSSNHEALPTVLIESLILKTQVVSTNCPTGPAEILEDDLSQFLSPVGDIDALSANIKKAIDNPVNITSKHIDKFNAKGIAKQYIELSMIH
ncbi:MAG: glycosyltransferase [Proteobacteria bacterium]|nr:glycosyltransferase [Pseudomonadota bacterium]MCH9711358.1 glycosyltransferase [Pseudomonadota bacterium]MCH9749337.1 glycosyltransferase [Pseudomonadota bacterium]